jgi:Predicted O-methyltransferase
MKKIIKGFLKLIITIGYPFTFIATGWLKLVRKWDMGNSAFMFWGLLPVPDHYYHPLINPRKHLKKSLREDRYLPAIDFNDKEQLKTLSLFHYNEEILQFSSGEQKESDDLSYYFNYGSFMSGDAEYLYNMVRHFKPSRIIEIGSGASTLISVRAQKKNQEENADFTYKITCIEPYEWPQLNKLNIDIIRKKVEDMDIAFFESLEANDILFIDSSHIIRPQGDVLFEYLEILPRLKPGVIVHIHDIFTPKDYLDEWVYGKEHRLWNEQYLLEAFLSFNKDFRIIGATNYLSHHYRKEFSEKCPVYAKEEGREPGSFWMVKN